MKKAKIMLTAIAVLAVVGGALAFKATTTSGVAICTTSTLGDKICAGDASNQFTADQVPLAQATFYYTTVAIDATCGDGDLECATLGNNLHDNQ